MGVKFTRHEQKEAFLLSPTKHCNVTSLSIYFSTNRGNLSNFSFTLTQMMKNNNHSHLDFYLQVFSNNY